jgi:hypothetical protein
MVRNGNRRIRVRAQERCWAGGRDRAVQDSSDYG